jgi:hypothetical protein
MAVRRYLMERFVMDKAKDFASKPFSPVPSTGAGPDYLLVRIDHALEYIAAQLGEINERLAVAGAAKKKAALESRRTSRKAPGGTRPTKR